VAVPKTAALPLGDTPATATGSILPSSSFPSNSFLKKPFSTFFNLLRTFYRLNMQKKKIFSKKDFIGSLHRKSHAYRFY
jgi:hypothetical protein